MNTKVKKGLKITGIVIGTILVIMLILPFAFKGKILEIVKSKRENEHDNQDCTYDYPGNF